MPSAPSRVKKRGFCHDDSAGSMVRIMVNLGAACEAYVAMTLHTPYCSSEAATSRRYTFRNLRGRIGAAPEEVREPMLRRRYGT